MLFNSWTFLLFFLIVFGLYQVLQNWSQQKLLLLVASYFFYAAWNPAYVLILLASTLLDWSLARWIARTDDARKRRLLLLASLVANLGLLGLFKYGFFLLDNLHSVLLLVGVSYQPPAWGIVLPIGISFYTFASLSYTIDVYRREVRADASLLDYGLFVSFFPHLVAGPIVRASQLLPQIAQPRKANAEQVGWGLTLVILGLFSKVVLADKVFAPVVDQVYARPSVANAADTWVAILGFSGQIYYDFSGYSLCAIGLALCFGFAFPDNFRHPYAARGFSDFWRRWHITLSTWLRDYLYIPLGGNRHGNLRTYLNLMLTMLIGGLWHGASWLFVLWGGLHGLFLAAERLVVGDRRSPVTSESSPLLGLTLFTFLAVSVTWIPFRSPDLGVATDVFAGAFRFGVASILAWDRAAICFVGIAATLAWHAMLRDSSLERRFGGLDRRLQAVVLGCCVIAMYLVSGGDERAFIYFQF